MAKKRVGKKEEEQVGTKFFGQAQRGEGRPEVFLFLPALFLPILIVDCRFRRAGRSVENQETFCFEAGDRFLAA